MTSSQPPAATGLIVAPDPRAAAAGARMLRAGGNAYDAAVATALATGVVEPFMSGLGGGCWAVAREASGRRLTVEGPAVAGAAASAAMYSLADDEPDGLYGWPQVQDRANTVGPMSVAVPGQVAALAELARRGRLSWATLVEPAIELAEGTPANWFMSACVTEELARLREDPGAAAIFCPGGLPVRSGMTSPADVVRQPALAATLRRVAEHGAEELRTGETARRIVGFLASRGGVLTQDDFASYAPVVDDDPVSWSYGGARLTGPVRTGVGSVVQALRLLEAQGGSTAPDDVRAERWARALRMAMADRLAHMSADARAGTDWDHLLSVEHAHELLGRGKHGPVPSGRAGCTSHLTVADAEGTVVSLTQTVLDLFGSRMVEPNSGVLLNDAMMYFDPRPDALNRVRPGSPGLSAVAPVVVETPDRVIGLGASGGRRIISAVAQLVDALVTDDAEPQRAIDAPRLHVEDRTVTLDTRAASLASALTEAGWSVALRTEEPTTWHFARPNAVARRTDGPWIGGADPHKPHGMEEA